MTEQIKRIFQIIKDPFILYREAYSRQVEETIKICHEYSESVIKIMEEMAGK